MNVKLEYNRFRRFIDEIHDCLVPSQNVKLDNFASPSGDEKRYVFPIEHGDQVVYLVARIVAVPRPIQCPPVADTDELHLQIILVEGKAGCIISKKRFLMKSKMIVIVD
jgi:hypothetical protein